MVDQGGDRSQFFAAIEKKHGRPIRYWLSLLNKLGDAKYADQIALLRNDHGFSQAHANAVVMYHRGSGSSRRYADADQYFDSIGESQAQLIRSMTSAIIKAFPQLELVIAWNQPMLKYGKQYVMGFSASKNHVTIGPWGRDGIAAFRGDLAQFDTNKKTFKVPLDWKVDTTLLRRLVKYRLDEMN